MNFHIDVSKSGPYSLARTTNLYFSQDGAQESASYNRASLGCYG